MDTSTDIQGVKDKTCTRCKMTKKETDFYLTKVGYMARCKQCKKELKYLEYWVKGDKCTKSKLKYYQNHKEEIKERMTKYMHTPRGKQARQANKERMRAKYPEKYKARIAFHYAIKVGKLVKGTQCEMHGDDCMGRIEGHHYKGYAPEHWLDVQWLCMMHHKRAEKLEGLEKEGKYNFIDGKGTSEEDIKYRDEKDI